MELLEPAVPLRAALYGDGLFETLRVHRGGLPLLGRHLARLRRDAPRLGFRLPDADRLATQLQAAASAHVEATLRLALFAPDGARGYARGEVAPLLQLGVYRLPPPDSAALRLRLSAVVLPAPDPLAGAKHCNRLAQVQAARGLPAGFDEALLRDPAGFPVCALSGNLWAVIGERVLTPPIRDCGVRGVLRDWLLELGPALDLEIAEAALTVADLQRADELFLSNALRGLRPVGELHAAGDCYRPGGAAYTRRLAAALQARGFPVHLPELP
ncbi:MAG: aminotransferase class IV [Xanthomonadales bacterium]|nr:aminotransferase class IV [Xanthomonadales bacterium]